MTVHTPIETRHGGLAPWAIWLTVFVFLVGGVYLASNLVGENPAVALPGESGSPPPSGELDPAVGQALYEQFGCQSCHGANLEGGVGPTLVGVAEGPVSENLQELAAEHPDDWAALWIDGTVPEVEGLDRVGMPVFGDQLSPEQIDAIVAFLLAQ